MEYGLIGEKLGHSFSKVIHEQIADYVYDLCEIPKDRVDRFFTEKKFKAINVTIPYKKTCMAYLDVTDPVAEEIGAVNTVVNKEGKLYGYNTDWLGLRDMILREGMDFSKKTVLILGTGGTSRTAGYVAKVLGAEKILFASRTRGDITYEEIGKNGCQADFIINTTPSGMYPENEGSPLDLTRITGLEGVVDVIFNPLRTNLVLQAKEMGIKATGGLYMLVSQAVYAIGYFLGKTISREETERVFEKIYKEKENIVFLGMPGSGKTTIGKILEENFGGTKKCVDLDEELVKVYGDIPEIFEKEGEAGFRKKECEITARFAKENGCIISTGGGVILREENIRRLRQNGKLVFLDRKPENIVPTKDRPLAGNSEAVKKRYEERYPLYCKAADVQIEVKGSPLETAKRVEAEIYENSGN